MIAIKPISGIKPTFSQYFKNVESTVVNKSKVSSGELKIDYVCDHYLISEWEAIKEGLKKNANSEKRFKVRTSSLLGSPAVANLRIYFEIKWPITALNKGSHGNSLEIDWLKFKEIYPFLANVNFCKPVNSVNPTKPSSQKNTRERQAKLYRKLLESGNVKNRAELARKFGVSRAWVTKVLGYNT